LFNSRKKLKKKKKKREKEDENDFFVFVNGNFSIIKSLINSVPTTSVFFSISSFEHIPLYHPSNPFTFPNQDIHLLTID